MHISSVVVIDLYLWFSFYKLGLRWPHHYSFLVQVIKQCLLLSPLQFYTHLFHICKETCSYKHNSISQKIRPLLVAWKDCFKWCILTKLNSVLNKTNCLSFTSETVVGATRLQVTNQRRTLREKCQYSELFWSVFSRIGTECGAKAGKYRQDNSEYGHFLRSGNHIFYALFTYFLRSGSRAYSS